MRRSLLVPVVLLLAAACGGVDRPAEETSGVPGLEVRAEDYRFEPVELTTTAGEVKIDLRNTGAVQHDFTIDSPKFQVTALPGQTRSGTVRLATGTYDFYCSVAGHRALGMKGELAVQ